MKKDDQLLIKLNKEQKKEFLKVCEAKDATASKVLRRMIDKYIEENK